MHTEIAKLHTIQKKYVLLREFARPNQEWADKADYIEFLYTDEAEHQGEILYHYYVYILFLSDIFRNFELRSKILPLGKIQIYLVFRSQIRIFAPANP